MHEPLARTRQIGALGIASGSGALGAAEHEVAAHPGGQVDHDVDVGRADPLDHLAVQLGVARALAGLGVAHVDVDDRRAGLGGLDRRQSAICSGVTGTLSARSVVAPAPVTRR